MSELLKAIGGLAQSYDKARVEEKLLKMEWADYDGFYKWIERLLKDEPLYAEYAEAVKLSQKTFEVREGVIPAKPYLDLTELLRRPEELKERLLNDPDVNEDAKLWLCPGRRPIKNKTG